MARWPLWTGGKEYTQILVFFQVGRFYEFYGVQAELAQNVLGLQPVTGLRGFFTGCGFHRRWLGRYIELAREKGFHVALINEYKDISGRVGRRLVRLIAASGKAKA